MVRALSHSRRPTGAPADNGTHEVQLAWNGGSIHLRSVAAGSCCERQFLRQDLAVGICFQGPGSALQWRVSGQVLLEKTSPVNSGARDLLILPAGHEFTGHCRGEAQDLWLFLQPHAISNSGALNAFAERSRVDSSWAQDPFTCALAHELRNECLRGFPRGPLFVQSAVAMLLSSLAWALDGMAPDAEPEPKLGEAKLSLVLEYIQQHLDRNITLAELAALAGLTPRYFCEVFRRATGRPPHQFQIEQRIERAKALLLRPGVPLREVALMAGFSSQSHLNVYFRRIAGITPASYRAQSGLGAKTLTPALAAAALPGLQAGTSRML